MEDDHIVLYRRSEVINNVRVEGTMVCFVETYNENYVQVFGNGPFYYTHYSDYGTLWDTLLNFVNDANQSLMIKHNEVLNAQIEEGNITTYTFYPDSVIDFRPYISQINS